jgi:hypothetical protein
MIDPATSWFEVGELPVSQLSLIRDYFAVPHVGPFVGASDRGHGFYWPETSGQAQESNLGPIK